MMHSRSIRKLTVSALLTSQQPVAAIVCELFGNALGNSLKSCSVAGGRTSGLKAVWEFALFFFMFYFCCFLEHDGTAVLLLSLPDAETSGKAERGREAHLVATEMSP